MDELPQENPYAAPRGATAAGAGVASYQYKPLFGRLLAVSICLGTFGAFSIFAIATGVGVGSSGQSVLEGWNEGMNEPAAPLTSAELVEMGEGLACIASIVAVCFFLPQANRNARALSGFRLRFTPAATVWWFLVPFMNLVRPYQAVNEIWQTSNAGPENPGFLSAAPAWMPLWWGSWIAFNVFSQLTTRLARSASDSADVTKLLERLAGLSAAAFLYWVASGIARAQAKHAEAPALAPRG
jgi:hypothetical protein